MSWYTPPRPRKADLIFEKTAEEIKKGYCSDLLTLTEVNLKFGAGRWRPLHRFVAHQADGKKRLIDDGRRGHQNEWAAVRETIYTISVDFVPAIASAVASAAQRTAADGDDLEWADVLLSTADLPDAFRGLPIIPDDQRAAVVAIWHPAQREWMFTIMDGCPFGLGVVVVHFNRYPTLVVAAARRIFAMFVAAYFDDCVQVEPQLFAESAGQLFLGILQAFGTPPEPSKYHAMAAHRVFLGTSMTVLREAGQTAVVIAPRQGTRQKLCTELQEVLNTRTLHPAQAGKLRGQSGWLASNSFGRVGRLGQAVLKRCQYGKHHKLDEHDAKALEFHMLVIQHVPPRLIPLQCAPYTSAGPLHRRGVYRGSASPSWHAAFSRHSSQAHGFAMEVPGAMVATWATRKQQIFPRLPTCQFWLRPICSPPSNSGFGLFCRVPYRSIQTLFDLPVPCPRNRFPVAVVCKPSPLLVLCMRQAFGLGHQPLVCAACLLDYQAGQRSKGRQAFCQLELSPWVRRGGNLCHR